MASKFITALFLGLASASALPRDAPLVIPGPGLPSVESLGLTAADLTAPIDRSLLAGYSPAQSAKASGDFSVMYTNSCGPGEAYTPVSGLIACFHYLNALGTAKCTAPGSGQVVQMCESGAAHVTGRALQIDPTTSTCAEVALGVLWTIDSCTLPDQRSAGNSAAYGNGAFVVGSSAKTYW